ncbi:MAG: hypothetical protein NW215_01880 [Hyphomicrobiales bacterium]|nr:hypothetical protein [Hyphomicrobiales bacterium]
MFRILLLGLLLAPEKLSASEEAYAAALAYFESKPRGDRGMNASCDANTTTTFPGYGDAPIQFCVYTVTSGGATLEGYVYLLNPTFENVARRIANACAFAQSRNPKACGKALAERIVNQNGAQFPVAGVVIEKKVAAGGSGQSLVNLEFRDGVATRTAANLYWTQTQITREQAFMSAQSKVVRAMRFARIADATRQDYRLAGGEIDVGQDPGDGKDQAWLDVVRDNELEARRSGRDVLLNGVALRQKQSGKLP